MKVYSGDLITCYWLQKNAQQLIVEKFFKYVILLSFKDILKTNRKMLNTFF